MPSKEPREISSLARSNVYEGSPKKIQSFRTIEKKGKTYEVPDLTIDLLNDFNLSYEGPIFMGSNLEEMTVVYDTGSDWLVIEGYKCNVCANNRYNYADEEGKTFHFIDTVQSALNYGSASTSGLHASDTVCLDQNSCVADFPFFVVFWQEGLSELTDGICGMSTGDFDGTGPLYINALKDAGHIKDRIFSFYLTSVKDEALFGLSHLDVGFIDYEILASELVWIHLDKGNFWWQKDVTGFSMTHPDEHIYERPYKSASYDRINAWKTSDNTAAITDTGTSCIYAPSRDFENIMSNLLNVFTARDYIGFDYEWGYLLNHHQAKRLPSLWLLFGGYWMEVLPADYLIDFEDGDYAFCIVENPDQFWLLGDAFLRGFYSVHDMDNMRMGFASIAGFSTNAPLLAVKQPTSYF